MDPFTALFAGKTPVGISLVGYPVAWVQATAAWDTGVRQLDAHLFYLVEHGDMLLDIGDSAHVLAAGTAALIPPGRAFRARAGGRAPGFWRFRIHLPQLWQQVLIGNGCRHLEPVVTGLLAELDRPAGAWRDAAVRGGLVVLLAGLLRAATSTVHAAERGLTPAQRTQLERFADAEPRATPRDLMRQLNLTLDYGTRLFRASYGLPPRRWLLARRMHAAAVRVAEGDERIAAIAADLGYLDERLFVRQFRAILGMPPGRFRRAARSA
jgi:AraC-like DNA-binding protein